MDEKQFAARLAQLRTMKGVSARDMSLSIGQTHSYINMIENGKMMPSLPVFFYICEYLGISPKDFFDDTNDNPNELGEIMDNVKRLNSHQRQAVAAMIRELTKR